MNATQGHNEEMIRQNAQSHQLPGEDPLLTRVMNGGFTGSPLSVGENVFAFTETALHGHTAFIVDWGTGPNGIQDPAGHRDNILDGTWEEVGISILDSPLTGVNDVGPFVMTQNFGTRATYGNARVLGVAFTDADGDNFYDAGEGLSGVTIIVSSDSNIFATETMSAGGFQVEVPPGTYDVTADGGGLAQPLVLGTVTVGSENVKIDLDTTVATAAVESISGTVFRDINESGFFETGDSGLAGRTVFIDTDGDGIRDAGETSATTAANGTYTLSVPDNGTFDVAIEADPFFRASAGSATSRSATVTVGNMTSGVNFGQVQFATASGSTLNIFGTSGNDQFDWTIDNGSYFVTVNDQVSEFSTATFDTVQFFGSGGEDSINLLATAADETATVNRGFMTITDGTYTVNATSFEDVDLDMGSGDNDVANMNDGSGDDDMFAHPTTGRLVGDTYNHFVANADRLTVTATSGGNDRAFMFDGPTDDRYIGRPDFSIFRGNNFEFFTQMEGFERNFAYSENGGEDFAFFFDSAGNDNFFGRHDAAVMQDAAVSYFNFAEGFARNFAFSQEGGNDTAFLTDDANGDDSFFGREEFSILRGQNFEFFNRAEGFGTTRAFSNGGNDNATFFDSAGDDLFEGFSGFSRMTIAGQLNNAQGFDQVVANSDNGGFDRAILHDSGASDLVFAERGHAFLSGPGFFNRVNNFDEVEAESSRGGNDMSTIIDPLDFTYIETGPFG